MLKLSIHHAFVTLDGSLASIMYSSCGRRLQHFALETTSIETAEPPRYFLYHVLLCSTVIGSQPDI